MKKKQLEEFKYKDIPELKRELQRRKERLANLKFKLSLGRLPNFSQLKHLKREIAQMATLLVQKESKS